MTTWMYDAKRKAESVTKKETVRVDLPAKGWLSSIAIKMSAKNGGTSNIENHLHDNVTKIEVVGAGGATIKSLTGVQAQGLNWFDGQRKSWNQMTEYLSEVNQEQFILNFGRGYMDTEYMLDCSKIIDGQLKFTYDLGTIRATAADSYLGTDQDIDIVYLIPDNFTGPAPKGYIKSTETKSWTSAASGINYVTIPKENPIRRIMLRAYESGISPAATLTNLKLTANNGAYIPWDNTLTKLKDLNSLLYKPANLNYPYLWIKDGQARETNIAFSEEFAFTGLAERAVGIASEAYGKVTLGLDNVTSATTVTTNPITSEEQVRMALSGYGYHNCFMLPFDVPKWDEGNLLNNPTPRYSELMLELTQGNEGAAASVVTEELIKQ